MNTFFLILYFVTTFSNFYISNSLVQYNRQQLKKISNSNQCFHNQCRTLNSKWFAKLDKDPDNFQIDIFTKMPKFLKIGILAITTSILAFGKRKTYINIDSQWVKMQLHLQDTQPNF